MRKKKSVNLFDTFWQPLLITYVIPLAILIVSILIQQNIDELASTDFYRTECDSLELLFFAKLAESLIPTTITFVITILLSRYTCYTNKQITFGIISTFIMGTLEILFPTMKDSGELSWLVLITYVFIAASLFLTAKGLSTCTTSEKIKKEKSDGVIQGYSFYTIHKTIRG